MKTTTALLIAGGIVAGALLWKRVGQKTDLALGQAASATAAANKVADAVNGANQAISPVTGALSDALGYVNNTFGNIWGSNQQKTYGGPGQGQFI